jgi:hypothetical protein
MVYRFICSTQSTVKTKRKGRGAFCSTSTSQTLKLPKQALLHECMALQDSVLPLIVACDGISAMCAMVLRELA